MVPWDTSQPSSWVFWFSKYVAISYPNTLSVDLLAYFLFPLLDASLKKRKIHTL